MSNDTTERAPEPEPISPELEELANDLVDLGLDALAEKGELTTTLACEDERGTRVMEEFEDDDVMDCVRAAREVVRAAQHKGGRISGLGGRPVRYAIAYDGLIRETEGAPYLPALIVEYGEQGLSSGYSAYLTYRKAGRPKDFVCSDIAAAGETELLV